MSPEHIAELRESIKHPPHCIHAGNLAECLDELDRLQNIVTIQQQQIDRLLTARDAERERCREWNRLMDSVIDNCSVTDRHVNEAKRLAAQMA